MEEKTIIKSEKYSGAKYLTISAVICAIIALILDAVLFGLSRGDFGTALLEIIVMFIVFYAVILVIYFIFSKCELTVSDKRVYGTAIFGKRVDLPVDSISAIGKSMFRGIGITTASGAIKFKLIKNRDEIYKVISDLLVARQNKPTTAPTTIKQEIPQSQADELKKYKELLDSGIITQEEFDAKKKQLLGL